VYKLCCCNCILFRTILHFYRMTYQEIFHQFIEGMRGTTWPEYIAVFAGIASVWFSRIENIWVYPVGLISTVIYIFLSMQGHLYGEASVNLYYTIMSIYGWVLWLKKDQQQHYVVTIQYSTAREWVQQLLFCLIFYVVIFSALTWLKQEFASATIPWADAFASATAYTGMWLMAKKKVESWYWWIATNIASIPLYFVKQYVFTSVFYFILLVMAVFGLIEWRKRARKLYHNRQGVLQ
jgi:nicotinamide mononucleotide transporter